MNERDKRIQEAATFMSKQYRRIHIGKRDRTESDVACLFKEKKVNVGKLRGDSAR